MQRTKQRKSIFTALLAVLVVITLTSALLGARVVSYAFAKNVDEIDLIADATGDSGIVENPSSGADMSVVDSQQVWETETNVDIFSISYDSENGEAVVKSIDGTKVVAPGTSGTYNFKICNTGSTGLNCLMYMESYFSNDEYKIPVEVKVMDYEDKYICGSEESWADFLELNNVSDSLVLDSAHYMGYTLTWEWPFESGNDEYDTLLGRLAADGEDLSLTIVIHTYAEEIETPDEDTTTTNVEETSETSTTEALETSTTEALETSTTETLETSTTETLETSTTGVSEDTTISSSESNNSASGGIPYTSDNFRIGIYAGVIVLAVAAIIFLLVYKRKGDKEEENKA